ncbi:MAG: hypothetical protein ACE5I1_27580 [bacterium]
MADYKKIKVRLNDKIEDNDGSFNDPVVAQTISKNNYSPKEGDSRGQRVQKTPFVEQRLASRELIEVLPNPQGKQKPSEESSDPGVSG